MHRKIIFITPSASQPRIIRRIESFFHAGYNVKVYSFERAWYNVNKLPNGVDQTILSQYSDRNYLRRLKLLFRHLIPLFKRYKSEDVIIYAMGFDNALFTALFGQKPYIYEISDIMYLKYPMVISNLFKLIDKFLIKNSLLAIFTSMGFYQFFFNTNKIDGYRKRKIIVLPNKVDPKLTEVDRPERKEFDVSRLRFGFVGLLRYPETVLTFIEVLQEPPFLNHEFHFYGDGPLKSTVLML